MRIITRNLLSFCIREYIIAFIYCIVYVALIELIFYVSGLFAEYDVMSVVIVSALLAGVQLCYCMSDISIDIVEDEEEDDK